MATITGLEAFRLTPERLARLGTRPIRLFVHLNTGAITADVLGHAPHARRQYLVKRAQRRIASLKRRFPDRAFTRRSDHHLSGSLEARMPAREVELLAKAPGVASVHVIQVVGIRKQAKSPPKLEWYCVRGRVVIQVEGQTRGRQTIEDRFVLVRAESFHDAERRLKTKWKDYADPYLNVDGLAVRWQLEKVVDVYATIETEIDPRGTEVYSRLSERRVDRARVWRPTRGSRD